MTNHFIHYTKRTITINTPNAPNLPFYAELQNHKSGFKGPRFHVTKSKSWPVTEIKNGDIIWLVSQLSTPWGKLRPALDGKIVVDKIKKISCKGKSKIRFSATKGSIWFPLADGTELLSNIEIVLKNGSRKCAYNPQKNNLGQSFQSIKKIHNYSIMNDYESKVLSKEYEFISYRIVDGTKDAFVVAKQRIELGYSVFWDRWSLPRRLAERREHVSDRLLDKFLKKKIKLSLLVWGIESPKYGEKNSYSQKEKKLACTLKKYHSYQTS